MSKEFIRIKYMSAEPMFEREDLGVPQGRGIILLPIRDIRFVHSGYVQTFEHRYYMCEDHFNEVWEILEGE